MNKKYEELDDVTVQLEATVIDDFDDGDILVHMKNTHGEYDMHTLVRDDDIVSED